MVNIQEKYKSFSFFLKSETLFVVLRMRIRTQKGFRSVQDRFRMIWGIQGLFQIVLGLWGMVGRHVGIYWCNVLSD